MLNKIVILMFSSLLLLATPCYAGGWHEIQDNVGADRFAHFACSYVIADQLHRHTKMNRFWAGMTTLAIGAAKEAWIDSKWDGGDFAADAAGCLFYQVEF